LFSNAFANCASGHISTSTIAKKFRINQSRNKCTRIVTESNTRSIDLRDAEENALNKNALIYSLLCSWALLSTSVTAQEGSRQEMRSLDEQVQEIKTDVLSISRDLSLLEERLLYPSNTELAVFVAMSADDAFRLDSVRIEIDGSAVAHYIYSFKELEALQSGGIQRVYTGNVRTGSHEMTVAVNGKLANGKDFTSSGTFAFSKEVDPKLLGLTLAEQSGGASIELGNW